MSEKCSHNHQQYDSAFKWAISLNLLFVVIEAYFGLVAKSLALLSDALHNFSDVVGLILVWFAFWLSKKVKHQKYSFWAAFVNALLLILSCLWIVYEAYQRYLLNQAPSGLTVILVAAVGIAINFFTAQKFHHHDHNHEHNHEHNHDHNKQKTHDHKNEFQNDLNINSAYLHLMADAAISAGVMITGIIFLFFPIYWLDAFVSAVISIIILFPATKLLKQSFDKIKA